MSPADPHGDAVANLDTVISEARAAAKAAGISHEPSQSGPRHWTSFAFRLEGLEDAVTATAMEREIDQLEGVESTIVFSTQMAWIAALNDVSPNDIQKVIEGFGCTATLTESSLRRRASSLELGHRRRVLRHAEAHQRAHDAAERRKRQDTVKMLRRRRAPFEGLEVLHTARELITKWRLAVALLFGLPVVAMQLFQRLQFDYWQWVCLGLATPVVLWSAWPFHRALAAGLRRGMSALDGASSVAIVVAYLYSAASILFTSTGDPTWRSQQMLLANSWSDPNVSGSIYLDVACGATILLLFGRLASRRGRLRSMNMLASLKLPENQAITVVRKNRQGKVVKKDITVAEIRVGDDIVVPAGRVIPCDGEIISGKAIVDLGPTGGRNHRRELEVNDYVYAGARALDRSLKVRARKVGSKTRLAAMQRWVAGTMRDENRVTQLTTKSASLLVPWSAAAAVATFALWGMVTGSLDAAMATGLSVLACVAPVALALSAPLALRLGLFRAATDGILLRDTATIHRMADLDLVIFNRVGTLTTGPMQLIGITPAAGQNPELLLRVAAALSMESNHAVSRAIVRADREARDANAGGAEVPAWLDVGNVRVTSDGSFEGTLDIPVDGELRTVGARLWRPKAISQIRDPYLATAALSGGSPLVVSWKGKERGVLNVVDTFKDDAPQAVEQLEELDIETFMLSRDPYPVARKLADSLGISTVLAGIVPSKKEGAVRGVHAQGLRVGMVGDKDIMGALRVADVGILMGAHDTVDNLDADNASQADVVLIRDDVMALPETINLVRHIRNTVDWNLWGAWMYNGVAVVVSALGLMNPLLATVAMLASSVIIERRSERILKSSYTRDHLKSIHWWQREGLGWGRKPTPGGEQ